MKIGGVPVAAAVVAMGCLAVIAPTASAQNEDVPVSIPTAAPTQSLQGLALDMACLKSFCDATNCLSNSKFNGDAASGNGAGAWDFATGTDTNGAVYYTQNPCSSGSSSAAWYGLTCTAISVGTAGTTVMRVTKIDMLHAGLSGTLSPALASMDQLQMLDLAHNALTGNFPLAFNNFGNSLIYISVESNNLNGPIGACDLQSLPNFSFIDATLSGLDCYDPCWDGLLQSGLDPEFFFANGEMVACTPFPTSHPTSAPTPTTPAPSSMPTTYERTDMGALEAFCDLVDCTCHISPITCHL